MIDADDILAARILIVDDQGANVLLLTRMLEEAGYRNVTATMNPLEVCSLHRKSGYDLILLDLQMPGMDGFQVMEGLKTNEGDGYLRGQRRDHGAARAQAARTAGRRQGFHQQALRSGGSENPHPQHD